MTSTAQKPSADELLARVEEIHKFGPPESLSGVFYALEEHRISAGKATQTVRNYLLTGVLDTFVKPDGEGECEAEIRRLRGALAALAAEWRRREWRDDDGTLAECAGELEVLLAEGNDGD